MAVPIPSALSTSTLSAPDNARHWAEPRLGRGPLPPPRHYKLPRVKALPPQQAEMIGGGHDA
jgi:hypothetical protein